MNLTNGQSMLQLEQLSKRYPNGVQAVKSLSLDVRAGEVFGLVGPNGAGKSTLLKLVAGLLRPEQGRVMMGDRELTGKPSEAAHWIGLMPDPLGVYTDISCREYLHFFAKVHRLEGAKLAAQMATAIELLGLGPWMESEVESLSAGWQRRLALGRMLLLDTPLLLLDEPAAGLDVRARAELLAIVRELSGIGRTVVISSHILPELEELADRFGIMNEGHWVDRAPGQTFFDRRELKDGLGGRRWRIRCADSAGARAALERVGLAGTTVEGGVEFTAPAVEKASRGLQAVVQSGGTVVDFRQLDTGLADVVLRVLEGGES
ncbi:MAG: ABC transporter ATP-binding protein [Kiritimatiellae bacterium]|nr:ABC transporter ATP-binding protein [Kiritimatiellia bacterium]MDD4341425.1 ABC transporter ATP-binding protein [Kiritimatiellia bacterium]